MSLLRGEIREPSASDKLTKLPAEILLEIISQVDSDIPVIVMYTHS